MVVGAVMVANAFNGLNTAAWTGWVVFAVTIGPILIWAYTVSKPVRLFSADANLRSGNLLDHQPRMVLCACLVSGD